jgi:hypothetical protein
VTVDTEKVEPVGAQRAWENFRKRAVSAWLMFAGMFILFGMTFPPLISSWPDNKQLTVRLLIVWAVITLLVLVWAVVETRRAAWWQRISSTPSDEEIQRMADEAEEGYDPALFVEKPSPVEAWHAKQYRWWIYTFVILLCGFAIYWPISSAADRTDWRIIVAVAVGAIASVLGAWYHNQRVRDCQRARAARVQAHLAIDGLRACEHHEGGEHVRPERMDS